MKDALLEDIDGLILQATTERSHFYTANLLRRVRAEIVRLREYEWKYRELSR